MTLRSERRRLVAGTVAVAVLLFVSGAAGYHTYTHSVVTDTETAGGHLRAVNATSGVADPDNATNETDASTTGSTVGTPTDAATSAGGAPPRPVAELAERRAARGGDPGGAPFGGTGAERAPAEDANGQPPGHTRRE